MTLHDKMSIWTDKWIHKKLTGRAIVELKDIQREAVKEFIKRYEGYKDISNPIKYGIFWNLKDIFGEGLIHTPNGEEDK